MLAQCVLHAFEPGHCRSFHDSPSSKAPHFFPNLLSCYQTRTTPVNKTITPSTEKLDHHAQHQNQTRSYTKYQLLSASKCLPPIPTTIATAIMQQVAVGEATTTARSATTPSSIGVTASGASAKKQPSACQTAVARRSRLRDVALSCEETVQGQAQIRAVRW